MHVGNYVFVCLFLCLYVYVCVCERVRELENREFLKTKDFVDFQLSSQGNHGMLQLNNKLSSVLSLRSRQANHLKLLLA